MSSDVAVIVVNYGTADLTISAVQSLLEFGGCEIHVVDNASPGNDQETLKVAHHERSWSEHVTLWLEAANHGFGRGNNVVLNALSKREVPPARVFLLNPDARLQNDAVSFLSATLENEPRAGAVGACVLHPDLTPNAAAFRFPSFASEMARVINFGPLDKLLHRWQVPLPTDRPAGPVDWVSGAAVMFRFDAIRDLGFFDPGFFLYYEEVDLMRRLRDRGWQVLYEPLAQVVHEEGAATGQYGARTARKRDPQYLYDSWTHYFRRANGRFGALMLALFQWPAALLNVIHRRSRGKAPTIPLRFFRDHARFVILPLLRGSQE